MQSFFNIFFDLLDFIELYAYVCSMRKIIFALSMVAMLAACSTKTTSETTTTTDSTVMVVDTCSIDTTSIVADSTK